MPKLLTSRSGSPLRHDLRYFNFCVFDRSGREPIDDSKSSLKLNQLSYLPSNFGKLCSGKRVNECGVMKGLGDSGTGSSVVAVEAHCESASLSHLRPFAKSAMYSDSISRYSCEWSTVGSSSADSLLISGSVSNDFARRSMCILIVSRSGVSSEVSNYFLKEVNCPLMNALLRINLFFDRT